MTRLEDLFLSDDLKSDVDMLRRDEGDDDGDELDGSDWDSDDDDEPHDMHALLLL